MAPTTWKQLKNKFDRLLIVDNEHFEIVPLESNDQLSDSCMAPLPMKIDSMGSSIVYTDRVLYVFGGTDTPTGVKVLYFDSEYHLFVREGVKCTLKHPRVNATVSLSPDHRYAYLVGGDLSPQAVERVDLTTMDVTQCASMNTPRIKHAATLLNDEGYNTIAVLGGIDPTTNTVLDTMELYDTLFDVWHISDHHLAKPMHSMYVSFVRPEAPICLVIGGVGSNGRFIKEIQKIHTEERPDEKATLPGPLVWYSSACHSENLFYLTGGRHMGADQATTTMIKVNSRTNLCIPSPIKAAKGQDTEALQCSHEEEVSILKLITIMYIY
ncbi:hypothetical protein SAMD00019534_109880, partial [Acytostelium subglobosum LB1]|uniref:hypothetical protein n=1 Tax=Acytostelium subglobosum LB1 TaxID=1410327 RepID=UPI000644A381